MKSRLKTIVALFAVASLLTSPSARSADNSAWDNVTLQDLKANHISVYYNEDKQTYEAKFPTNLSENTLNTRFNYTVKFPRSSVGELLNVFEVMNNYRGGFMMRAPGQLFVATDAQLNAAKSATGSVGGRYGANQFVGIGTKDVTDYTGAEIDFVVGHEVGHRVFEESLQEFLKEYLVGKNLGDINEQLMDRLMIALAGVIDLNLIVEDMKSLENSSGDFDSNDVAEIKSFNERLLKVVSERQEQVIDANARAHFYSRIKKLNPRLKLEYLTVFVKKFTRGFDEVFADFFGLIVAQDQTAAASFLKKFDEQTGLNVDAPIRSFELGRAESAIRQNGNTLIDAANADVPHLVLPRIRGVIFEKFYNAPNGYFGDRTYDLFVADQLLRFAQLALVKVLARVPNISPAGALAASAQLTTSSQIEFAKLIAETFVEFQSQLTAVSADQIKFLFADFRAKVIMNQNNSRRQSIERSRALEVPYMADVFARLLNAWTSQNRNFGDSSVSCAEAMGDTQADSAAAAPTEANRAALEAEMSAPVSTNMPQPLTWQQRAELAQQMADRVSERVNVEVSVPASRGRTQRP